MAAGIQRLGVMFLIWSCLGLASPSLAAQDRVIAVYLFWAKGCFHCAHEKDFLAKLEGRQKHVKVVTLEVTESRQNRDLFKRVGEALGADVSGVPFTVVANQYVIGWYDEASTGQAIEKALQKAREEHLPDVVASLLPAPRRTLTGAGEVPAVPEKLTVPFFGEIEVKHLSLGLLTLIIGLLDGFNPCAMWVLIFLINLLLGMEDRKKMWILGSVFILASGGVYFLFMAAWLNLLVFLGFIVWVRIIIGCVALLAGGYNLREWLTNRAGVCKLSLAPARQKKMDRIKQIIQTKNFLLALGGIILLAFAVNLVELICSAGFPVVYLQVLSLTPMPIWQYYLYLGFYIFLFMLDDMLVFGVSMATLQLLGIGTKYKQVANLVGGVLMLILGILLILKPEMLVFG